MIVVDVVTPAKKMVEGAKVAQLKLPSSTGELLVLPGHTELLTILGTGELSFVENGMTRRFAVSYGFAEIRHDKVLVLAETCEEAKDIDKPRAEQAQKKAEQSLKGLLSEDEFEKNQLKLQRSIVRQQIAQ